MTNTTLEKGTRIWVRDSVQGWIGGCILETNINSKNERIINYTTDEENTSTFVVPRNSKLLEDDLPLRSLTDEQDLVNDLTQLNVLNEPNLLHSLKSRFDHKLIYTYSGIVLVAMNPYAETSIYSNQHINSYASSNPPEEPHVYSVARAAYDGICNANRNQTIIVSGESGAGKTVSARHVMRYFAVAGKQKDHKNITSTEEKILATNPVMEAFGNAKTLRNSNSSRFGRYLQIYFDDNNLIVGAHIRIFLLERSRLVYQPHNERNTHIFYQLCAGAKTDYSLKRELKLGTADEYHYLNQGKVSRLSGVDDSSNFVTTRRAMTSLGIDNYTQKQIFKLLAALLHLGNIQINQTSSARQDASISSTDPSLLHASELLGVSAAAFQKGLIQKTIGVGGGRLRQDSEKIVTSLNRDQSVIGRDSLARLIYTRLFDWLVIKLNSTLLSKESGASDRAKQFVGVLDIYGFEHFQKNSFEQFCINYANEKLQQEFNIHTFKLSQQEYEREGLKVSYINYPDNQPCIDMIESRVGLLALLDEQCRLPAGSDSGLRSKMDEMLRPPYKKTLFSGSKSNSLGAGAFTIAHYAHDVTYDVDGFLEKNRDIVPEEHKTLLNESKNSFVKEIYTADLTPTTPPSMVASPSTSVATPTPSSKPTPFSPSALRSTHASPQSSSRMSIGSKASVDELSSAFNKVHVRSPSLSPWPPSSPNTTVGTPSIKKQPTLGGAFKISLNNLMNTINETDTHYIRCIKPASQETQSWSFDNQKVLSQLRASGVLETIRISRAGYPSKLTYDKFAEKYEILISRRSSKLDDSQTTCQKILQGTITNKNLYAFGKTKIFFRVGVLAHLDKLRSILLNRIVAIQASARSTLATKKYIRHQASIAVEAKSFVNIQAISRAKLVRMRLSKLIVAKVEETKIRERAQAKSLAEKENARSSTSTITQNLIQRPEKSPIRLSRESTLNGKPTLNRKFNTEDKSYESDDSDPNGSIEVLEYSRNVVQHSSKPSFASSVNSSSTYSTAYMDEILPPAKPPRNAARASRGPRSSLAKGPQPTPPERTTSLSNANDPRVNKRSSRGFSSPFFMG